MEAAAVGAGDHTVWVNLLLDEPEAGEPALEVSEDLWQGVEIRQANHKAFGFFTTDLSKNRAKSRRIGLYFSFLSGDLCHHVYKCLFFLQPFSCRV